MIKNIACLMTVTALSLGLLPQKASAVEYLSAAECNQLENEFSALVLSNMPSINSRSYRSFWNDVSTLGYLLEEELPNCSFVSSNGQPSYSNNNYSSNNTPSLPDITHILDAVCLPGGFDYYDEDLGRCADY